MGLSEPVEDLPMSSPKSSTKGSAKSSVIKTVMLVSHTSLLFIPRAPSFGCQPQRPHMRNLFAAISSPSARARPGGASVLLNHELRTDEDLRRRTLPATAPSSSAPRGGDNLCHSSERFPAA